MFRIIEIDYIFQTYRFNLLFVLILLFDSSHGPDSCVGFRIKLYFSWYLLLRTGVCVYYFFSVDVSEHMFFIVTVSCRVHIYVCTYVRVYNFLLSLA